MCIKKGVWYNTAMVVDRISKVVAVAALLAIPAWGEDDILVNKPDFVVFRPKMPISWQRRNPDSPRTPQEMRMTGDCYNDHFQVLEDAKRRMLFAFWTQASYEGCSDQHIAFSKSSDQGRTWTEPEILAGSACRALPMRRGWY